MESDLLEEFMEKQMCCLTLLMTQWQHIKETISATQVYNFLDAVVEANERTHSIRVLPGDASLQGGDGRLGTCGSCL
jgi:hypothetical protein